MALTHVSMWSQHGWKRVTIEDVVKSHPGGTVSARSGLFKCDLCGQYVTLADGPIRASYFKHNSKETDKDCQERSLSLSKNNSFKPEIHDLPLRIVVNRNKFSFELGFTPLPQQIFEKNREKQILINAKGIAIENFQYDWSRINNDTTNYLYVGENPAETYGICIANSKDDDYKSYWPKEIEGSPNKGILFDSENGLKLVQYKDVCVNHHYYLLKRGWLTEVPQSIMKNKVCEKRIGLSTWFLYEITVQKATKEAAIFLYDLNRYNLTDQPSVLQPIWPVFQVDPYLIRHESDSITFYLNGDAEPKIFPSEILLTSNCETGKVISVKNSNKQQLRQQLLAIGKTKTMDYQYIRYGMRNYQFDAPEVFISDASGEQFAAGKNKKLPPKQLLRVSSSVDGFIERFHKENLTEVLPLYADKALSITKLRYGDSIFIYLGLDMVWQAQFERIEADIQINDNQLLNQLKKCKGESIHINHSIGTLAIKMKNFPLSKRWLSKAIVSGKINKDAYLLLITLFGNKEK